MRTYHVTNNSREEVERTETENFADAKVIARVMSMSSEEQNSGMYFVEDQFRNIICMFYDGREFREEEV